MLYITINKKISVFKLLPKLHKQKFSIRPILNCRNNISHVLSSYIDFILKPNVVKQKGYLKDSQNLIQNLLQKKFDDDINIYSADFESLHTNLPLNDCINIICKYVQEKN